MSSSFQVGDLVWAKMKGFSPWPGRVSIPTLGMKPPKNMSHHLCVYFFGSNNYGWVKQSNMKPYQAFKEKMMMYCNTSAFKSAVNDIGNYMEKPENFGIIDGPVQDGIEENGVPYENGVDDDFGDIQIKEEPEENGDADGIEEFSETPSIEEKTSAAVPPNLDATLRLDKVKVYKCDQCPNMYSSSDKLDEHSKIHVHIYSSYVKLDRTEVLRYSCRSCGQRFQQLRECRLHELMHVRQENKNKKKSALNEDNGIPKPYQCEGCDQRFALQSTLTAHSVLHQPFPYMCDCGIGYFRETDFKAHRQAVHPSERKWIPKTNYKGPKRKSEFVVKKRPRPPSPDSIVSTDESIEGPIDRAWPSKPFKTKIGIGPKSKAELVKKKRGRKAKRKKVNTVQKERECKKLKNALGEEVDILKNEMGRFACPLCDKHFKDRKYVFAHYGVVHTDERPFACERCGQRFKQKPAYENHLSLHGLGRRKYVCDYCDAGYLGKERLELHIINEHLGCRPYVCEICKKRFAQALSLKTHSKIHQGIRDFVCGYCKKGFPNAAARRLHERTHTGEKPYACSYCQKAFSDPSAFQRHIRTHTGDKRYACDECSMRFSDKSGLIAHKKRHAGLRTKECDICLKKFYSNSDLNKHVLAVHALVRKFECDPCGHKFSSKMNLQTHIRAMHQLVFCDACGLGFRKQKYLQKHMAKSCPERKKVRKKMKKESFEIPVKIILGNL